MCANWSSWIKSENFRRLCLLLRHETLCHGTVIVCIQLAQKLNSWWTMQRKPAYLLSTTQRTKDRSTTRVRYICSFINVCFEFDDVSDGNLLMFVRQFGIKWSAFNFVAWMEILCKDFRFQLKRLTQHPFSASSKFYLLESTFSCIKRMNWKSFWWKIRHCTL